MHRLDSAVVTVLVLLVGVVGLAATPADAQVPERELADSVEERYEVLPAREGVLLRPREESAVTTVEIADGDVFVDGSEVDDDELDRLVGSDDADRFERLAELDATELARLFGLGAVGAATEAEADAPAVVAEPEPVDEGTRQRVEEDFDRTREELERKSEEIAQRAQEIAREAEERARRVEERHRRRTGDARVVFGSSVHVRDDEVLDDVVVLGGSVKVDGEVRGDVVAIGGTVRVAGRVTGDVVSVGGSVYLDDQASIGGEVVSVGGGVHRDSGARIDGPITEVALWDALWEGDWDRGDNAVFELIGSLIFAAVVFLIGAVVLLVARGPMERVSRRISQSPWTAGAIGLAALVFFFPVVLVTVILLCVSIIGIPLLLLVPVAIFAFFLACFFGYVASAYGLGRWGESRFGWNLTSPIVALLLGIVFLHGWTITARLLDVVDTGLDVAGFVVLLLLFFGFTVMVLAGSVGLGGVLMATVNGGRRGQPASPPPPPPTSPHDEGGESVPERTPELDAPSRPDVAGDRSDEWE